MDVVAGVANMQQRDDLGDSPPAAIGESTSTMLPVSATALNGSSAVAEKRGAATTSDFWPVLDYSLELAHGTGLFWGVIRGHAENMTTHEGGERPPPVEFDFALDDRRSELTGNSAFLRTRLSENHGVADCVDEFNPSRGISDVFLCR